MIERQLKDALEGVRNPLVVVQSRYCSGRSSNPAISTAISKWTALTISSEQKTKGKRIKEYPRTGHEDPEGE
jgi:hypothetical protein